MTTWVRSTNGKWHILDKDRTYACNKAIRVNLFAKSKTGPNEVSLPDHDCCQNCEIKRLL